MIIAVCGLKGGVGKTTTTLSLSGAFCAEGRRPLLLDLDPGASLSLWSRAAREAGRRPPISLALRGELAEAGQIRELARGFPLTLVDAPGQLRGPTLAAMAAADLVLLPCSPDAPDVWALARTLELAGTLRRETGAPPRLLAVPARHDLRRSGEVERLRKTLAECGLATSRATLPLRAAHARALAEGALVEQLAPTSPAAAEARALAGEVVARLGNTRPRGAELRH